MRNILTFLIILFIVCSCGTGPWFIKKKEFQTYREDIYTLPNNTIKTNGYYLQVGNLYPGVGIRFAIIFYENGYTTDFWLQENELQSEIKTKIIQNKDTLRTDLAWWKIHNDSLFIEHYSELSMEMTTSNYFQIGKIINDSVIELKYANSSRPSDKYRFIETDSLPNVINDGRYLKKNWYNNGLNKNRKTTANNR